MSCALNRNILRRKNYQYTYDAFGRRPVLSSDAPNPLLIIFLLAGRENSRRAVATGLAGREYCRRAVAAFRLYRNAVKRFVFEFAARPLSSSAGAGLAGLPRNLESLCIGWNFGADRVRSSEPYYSMEESRFENYYHYLFVSKVCALSGSH